MAPSASPRKHLGPCSHSHTLWHCSSIFGQAIHTITQIENIIQNIPTETQPSNHRQPKAKTCAHCGQTGHYFRQCKSTTPLTPTKPCPNCKGSHWLSDCTQPRPSTSSAPSSANRAHMVLSDDSHSSREQQASSASSTVHHGYIPAYTITVQPRCYSNPH